MVIVNCGECGAPMRLRETKKYWTRDGEPKKFFGCSRWPECNGIHGAHPDGTPLGIPANAVTKAARIRAHDAFDRLWKDETSPLTRKQAYAWMQAAMGLTKEQAHIGNFDLIQCDTLIERVKAYATELTGGAA